MDITAAINNANFIVSTFLTENLATEFASPEPGVVEFKYVDTLTGNVTVGTYIMNDNGIVTNYGVVGFDAALGVVAAFLNNLNGGPDDFFLHAFTLNALYDNPIFEAELSAAQISGYGQGVANMIDGLPGANPFDPQSTLVQIGEGAQYFA